MDTVIPALAHLINQSGLAANPTESPSEETPKQDPVRVLITSMVYFLLFFYFASETMSQLLGFYYPIYWGSDLIAEGADVTKLRTLFQYFYIYGHLQLVTTLLGFAGVYAYHPRIALSAVLIYMLSHHPAWLEDIYRRVRAADILAFRYLDTIKIRILTEYQRIREETEPSTKPKED